MAKTRQSIKRGLEQTVERMLEEHGQVFREVLIEAVEDLCLVEAMKEAEGSPEVSEEQVMASLRRKIRGGKISRQVFGGSGANSQSVHGTSDRASHQKRQSRSRAA